MPLVQKPRLRREPHYVVKRASAKAAKYASKSKMYSGVSNILDKLHEGLEERDRQKEKDASKRPDQYNDFSSAMNQWFLNDNETNFTSGAQARWGKGLSVEAIREKMPGVFDEGVEGDELIKKNLDYYINRGTRFDQRKRARNYLGSIVKKGGELQKSDEFHFTYRPKENDPLQIFSSASGLSSGKFISKEEGKELREQYRTQSIMNRVNKQMSMTPPTSNSVPSFARIHRFIKLELSEGKITSKQANELTTYLSKKIYASQQKQKAAQAWMDDQNQRQAHKISLTKSGIQTSTSYTGNMSRDISLDTNLAKRFIGDIDVAYAKGTMTTKELMRNLDKLHFAALPSAKIQVNNEVQKRIVNRNASIWGVSAYPVRPGPSGLMDDPVSTPFSPSSREFTDAIHSQAAQMFGSSYISATPAGRRGMVGDILSTGILGTTASEANQYGNIIVQGGFTPKDLAIVALAGSPKANPKLLGQAQKNIKAVLDRLPKRVKQRLYAENETPFSRLYTFANPQPKPQPKVKQGFLDKIMGFFK